MITLCFEFDFFFRSLFNFQSNFCRSFSSISIHFLGFFPSIFFVFSCFCVFVCLCELPYLDQNMHTTFNSTKMIKNIMKLYCNCVPHRVPYTTFQYRKPLNGRSHDHAYAVWKRDEKNKLPICTTERNNCEINIHEKKVIIIFSYWRYWSSFQSVFAANAVHSRARAHTKLNKRKQRVFLLLFSCFRSFHFVPKKAVAAQNP